MPCLGVCQKCLWSQQLPFCGSLSTDYDDDGVCVAASNVGNDWDDGGVGDNDSGDDNESSDGDDGDDGDSDDGGDGDDVDSDDSQVAKSLPPVGPSPCPLPLPLLYHITVIAVPVHMSPSTTNPIKIPFCTYFIF